MDSGSSQGAGQLPKELEGFSWAAFLWGGIWAVGYGVWIGLLSFVPLVGFAMNIVLGLRGPQWAWEKGKIRDVASFKKAQRTWVIVWCAVTVVVVPLTGIFSALAIVGVKQYIGRAKQAEGKNTLTTLAAGMKTCAAQGELPASSDWVPAAPDAVQGKKYQSAASDWAPPAFACQGFSLANPQYYRYRWVQATTASGQFEAQADLDGDGTAESQMAIGVHCTPAEGCVVEPLLGAE